MPSVAVRDDNYRGIYQPFSADLFAATGDAVSNVTLAGARTGHTIFVRYLIIVITTSAAQSITVYDNAGTPRTIAVLPNSSAVGAHVFDFGEEGVALTEGQLLRVNQSAAGNAFALHVEGYYRQTAVLTPAQLASA